MGINMNEFLQSCRDKENQRIAELKQRISNANPVKRLHEDFYPGALLNDFVTYYGDLSLVEENHIVDGPLLPGPRLIISHDADVVRVPFIDNMEPLKLWVLYPFDNIQLLELNLPSVGNRQWRLDEVLLRIPHIFIENEWTAIHGLGDFVVEYFELYDDGSIRIGIGS